MIPQAVGIIRVSGDGLWSLLHPFFPTLPAELEHRRIYLGTPMLDALPLDECLLLYFKAPHSYTGEDLLEIHAHGNPHNIRALLHHLSAFGIRTAKPGEFSLRAYRNKKMSLLKAESLHRMIQAPSYKQFLSSQRQFSDETSHPLARLQEDYRDLLAAFFTTLDHPDADDEESESLSINFLRIRLQNLRTLTKKTSATFRKDRRTYRGFTVLLAGHPNSGKSSLFNRLIKDNRAIVSPVPGTTRDLVEGRLAFSFGDVTLLDSAGLRPASEFLEQEGIKRTLRSLMHADCILWVCSPDYPDSLRHRFPENLRATSLALWNKCDLAAPADPRLYDHIVSARTRKGLSSLFSTVESLAREFYDSSGTPEAGTLDSERQRGVLSALGRSMTQAISFLDSHQVDLALGALEEGQRLLDDGVGVIPASDIYDRVFHMFCLGK